MSVSGFAMVLMALLGASCAYHLNKGDLGAGLVSGLFAGICGAAILAASAVELWENIIDSMLGPD